MEITSFQFDANDSLLRITLAGAFSLPEAKAQFVDTVGGIAKHQAKNILIDGRALTGAPIAIERFLYGEFVAKIIAGLGENGVSRTPRFAYVMVEPVLDRHRLGEAVATNRGVDVKAFDKLSAAEEWLLAAS